MKKIIISALIICSSFTYAATPNEPKQAIDENLTSVQWAKPPKPSYTNDDLQGSERTVTIKMYVSEDGSIKQTKIVKSTGIEALDLKVHSAVISAKFKPYTENGVRYPFIAEQPFHLTLNKTERPWWKKIFFIP